MVKQICIKTREGTFCKASPVTDCSCRRNPNFRDPFPEVPCHLDLAAYVADFQGLVRAGGASGDKLVVLAKVARLILLNEVSVDGCFVITQMEIEDTSKGDSEAA